jgi:anthranilate/para-aminobenzoate synthase component I
MEDAKQALLLPAEARPAVLEGRWLGLAGHQALVAAYPASVLEGGPDLLPELPSWLERHTRQFPAGGAVGFFAYELARAFERLPLAPAPGLPDFSFSYYPTIEQVESRDLALPSPQASAETEVQNPFDEKRFIAGVEIIRQYIAAGDIYQANLTQQFSARLRGASPQAIYGRVAGARARRSAFLQTPILAIVSNSPERFFQVRDGCILASPIKGTLARSGDPTQDEELVARLRASRKDRAENVMIVDLLRNDLGRICDYESIHARLWEVETLPHLFHLVSHVEGELRPGAGLLEILRALFPCGSITGAPKIRAMEILAELETAPRGVSMGAIGIIRGAPGRRDFEMDFSVAIRTLSFRGDIASFNAGGGIVYDSGAPAEYQEMLLKAQPLLAALGVAPTGKAHSTAHAPRQNARAMRS